MNADIEFLTIFTEICLGTTAFFAIAAGTYLPYYLAKRRKITTPGSKTAVFVMFLSSASWINVVLALSGLSELPLPTAAILHFVLSYACMLLVFVIFLGSFMRIAVSKP